MASEQKTIADADARELEIYRVKMRHRGWVEADGVKEQCWYWWWGEDPDVSPVPVSVLHSYTDDCFFASRGQLGWTQSQNVLDMRGWWMKLLEPSTVPHPLH